jgi:hypothetical protein
MIGGESNRTFREISADNAKRAHPETTLFLNWLRAAMAAPPAGETAPARSV